MTDTMENVALPTVGGSSLRELTSQECTAIARSLTESLDHFDVAVHESSDLATMIHEIGWMGSFGGAPLLPGGAIDVDRQRTLRALISVLQARDIARTLEACRHAVGDTSKVEGIRGKIDRQRYQDASAQNALFELEVAGLLLRAGLEVELSTPPHPDVVCRLNGAAIGFECKRVQNRDRLRQQLKKARKQITKQDLPAAVIIDVQPLLYRTNDPKKPVYFDLVPSIEELLRIHSAQIRELGESIAPDVQKAFDSGVAAVVLCAMTWGMSEQPSAYVWSWIVEPFVPKTEYDVQLAHAIRVALQQR